jgi:hypothetical protein
MPSDRKPPELRAPEQNPFLGAAARGVAGIEDAVEKYFELPLDLFLPVSSEFLEKASYGDPLFRMPTQSNIPITADREYLMEALLGPAMYGVPAAKGLGRAAKSMGKPARPRFTEEELSYLLNELEAQRFSKGGGVKRGVDFLAEVLKGGSKPTDTKRRAAMGLPEEPLDLTPQPPKERSTLTTQPPPVVNGKVTFSPEVVEKAKRVLEQSPNDGSELNYSIMDTKTEKYYSLRDILDYMKAMDIPMSRRDVLRAGAGQAMSAMAPRGAMGALMKAAASPAELMKQAVTAPAPKAFSPLTAPGLIAQGLKMRMSDEAIAKMVKDQLGEELEDWVIPNMRRPQSAWDFDDIQEAAQGPLHYFTSLIDRYYEPGSSVKQAMREIREVNPKLYKRLKETARDTDMSVAEIMPQWSFGARLESAQDMAQKGGYPFNVNKFLERHGYVVDIEDADEIADVLKDFGYSSKDFE